jgi:hypothetical protein
MNLALLLNVHENNPVVIDTLDSIFAHATKDVLVLVDGVAWNQFNNFDVPVSLMCGFKHGCPRSPYRNVALGLKMLFENWPLADWYCYTEYDTLFTSDLFKKNLKAAAEMGIWMLGNDGHIDYKKIPLVEAMLGVSLNSYYLLGCCQFFSREFMQKMADMNFFDRFLNLTNQFTEGYMPGYTGYDVSEHLYPSLCRHLGGNVGVFSSYDEMGRWHGHYRQFPVRWRPEISEAENFPETSILHPSKDINSSIRKHHRELRKWNTPQMT